MKTVADEVRDGVIQAIVEGGDWNVVFKDTEYSGQTKKNGDVVLEELKHDEHGNPVRGRRRKFRVLVVEIVGD